MRPSLITAALGAVATLAMAFGGGGVDEAGAKPKPQTRPNLIVILLDDMPMSYLEPTSPNTIELLGNQGTTFSEWSPEQIQTAIDIAGADVCVSSQPQYSMLWQAPEVEVFPLCADHGISQIVWSPLAQGVLTGKYEPGRPPPADSRAANDEMSFAIERYMDDRVLEAVQGLSAIADEAGLTMTELALAWVLRRPELASAIIGASRPEQVHANVAASGVALSDDTIAAVDAALGEVVVSGPELAGFAREGVKHR